MMHKVFVASKLEEVGLKKLRGRGDMKVVSIPKPTSDELLKHLSDSEAIIIKSNVKLTADVLGHAKKLRIICRAGAGVDNVDVRKATAMGIPVTNTPGLNSNSVAEQVFSYIHTLYKSIPLYDRSTKDGLWEKGKYKIHELRGKTIGIAGMGFIGRRVLEKATGYRMSAIVYDPYLSKTMAEDLGVTLTTELKDLFRKCDVVTLHMPATPETKESITRELLGGMKKNAIFVNTARGNLLTQGALEGALADNDTLRAGVDVYMEDKPGKKDLSKYADRVVLTPHIAGNSLEGQLEIAELAADTVIGALTKDRLTNLVNFVKIPEELDRAYMELAEALGHTAATFVRNKGQLEEIRITCYDKLNPYGDVLVKPAIKGALSQLVDGGVTLINAEAQAKEMGTKIVPRSPDKTKGYGMSITVDVMVRYAKRTEEISVRGKLIEGEPTIVRIDNYSDLRIRPQGSQAFFIYADRPGVIGIVSTLLGQQNVNIESILARTDKKGKTQLLAIRTTEAIPDKLFQRICGTAETKKKLRLVLARKIQFGA